MKTPFQFLLKDGSIKESVLDFMGLVAIALIWGAAYFFEKWEGYIFWTVMLLGGGLGYVSAYSGLAKKFGYKPFTNDPLGWRKAKESYAKEAVEEQLKSDLEKPKK